LAACRTAVAPLAKSSAADEQSLGLGQPQHLVRVFPRQGERLLGVHMLAGSKRLQVDRGVGRRSRQVEHQLDFRIGKQLLHAPGVGDAELLGPLGGEGGHQVGNRFHFQDVIERLRHVFQVNSADLAGPDDAGLHFAHVRPLLQPNGMTRSHYGSARAIPQ